MAVGTLLDGPTLILRDALSGLSRRQQLIANNLANVDTPGYRAYDIPFEQMLERQMKSGAGLAMAVTSPGHMTAQPASFAAPAELQRQAVFRSDGNGVDVDTEMASLAETAIQYNATTRLLSARLALFRLAVTEGKR